MSLFHFVILIDVVAIATIAALIFALSISRPADQVRSDMAAVVHAIVNRVPLSRSGYVRTLSFDACLNAHLVNRRWSSHLVTAPLPATMQETRLDRKERAPSALDAGLLTDRARPQAMSTADLGLYLQRAGFVTTGAPQTDA